MALDCNFSLRSEVILVAAIKCLQIKPDPDKGCEQMLSGFWAVTGAETSRLETGSVSPGVASPGAHGGESLGFSIHPP